MDEKKDSRLIRDKDGKKVKNTKPYHSEVKMIYHFFHKLLNKFNPIKDFE